MNKNSFVLLQVAFLSLLLFSCKNFLGGTEFLSQLDDALNYANLSYVSVTITAPNSTTESIVPAAGEYTSQYKKGDTFTIRFKPAEYCLFAAWEITPEGAVSVADPTATETTFTILSDSEPIEIKTVCSKVPKVVQYTPTYDSVGVNCGSLIKIFFDQSMNDPANIYWTYDELAEMGKEPKHSDFVAKVFNEKEGTFTSIAKNGLTLNDNDWEQNKKLYYYYGYLDGSYLIMKNIKVTVSDGNGYHSLLTPNRFMSPYFETPNVLVIPPKRSVGDNGTQEALPANSDIAVTISSEMKNSVGIHLREDFSFYYKTSGINDTEPPKGYISNILGYWDVKVPFEKDIETETYRNIDEAFNLVTGTESISVDAIKNCKTKQELLDLGVKPVKNLALIQESKLLYSKTCNKITDNLELSSLSIKLVPVTTNVPEYKNTIPQEYTRTYFNQKEVILNTETDGVIYDIPKSCEDGVYEIFVYAADKYGNIAQIKCPNNNNMFYNIYCIVDNSRDTEFEKIMPTETILNKTFCPFDLYIGQYYFIDANAQATSIGIESLRAITPTIITKNDCIYDEVSKKYIHKESFSILSGMSKTFFFGRENEFGTLTILRFTAQLSTGTISTVISLD